MTYFLLPSKIAFESYYTLKLQLKIFQFTSSFLNKSGKVFNFTFPQLRALLNTRLRLRPPHTGGEINLSYVFIRPLDGGGVVIALPNRKSKVNLSTAVSDSSVTLVVLYSTPRRPAGLLQGHRPNVLNKQTARPGDKDNFVR